MSSDNLERVRDLYRSWAAGDLSDASLFDPYVVAVFPDPHKVPLYGLEAMSDYMRRFLESWENVRFEGTDYREVGDSIVVRVRRSGTGKKSGMSLEDHPFHVWTFRGERVIRIEVFDRDTEALEAAGLSE
jgi:ketosteroid isomerase-like protein